jgi:hypothetical protein
MNRLIDVIMPLIGCHRLGKGAYSIVSWLQDTGWPLIVCNRLGENEPITSLNLEWVVGRGGLRGGVDEGSEVRFIQRLMSNI